MEWHKIIFTVDQVTEDEYYRLIATMRDAVFQNPVKYRDVAIFEPRYAFDTKYFVSQGKVSFFTPDAVRYFWELLEPYSPEPCERPPEAEVGTMLAVGEEIRSRLWQ